MFLELGLHKGLKVCYDHSRFKICFLCVPKINESAVLNCWRAPLIFCSTIYVKVHQFLKVQFGTKPEKVLEPLLQGSLSREVPPGKVFGLLSSKKERKKELILPFV